jgi:hypothetical protein
VRHIVRLDAAAAIHARKIVDAFFAFAFYALAYYVARMQHTRDLFVSAFEYGPARIPHNRVDVITKAVLRFYVRHCILLE